MLSSKVDGDNCHVSIAQELSASLQGFGREEGQALAFSYKAHAENILKKPAIHQSWVSIPTLYPLLPLSVTTVFPKLFLLCAAFPAS